MIRVTLVNIFAFAILSCAAAETTVRLSQSDILFDSNRDLKWKTEIYDKIKGNSHAEKAQNALSTWEMKAVSEVEIWELEDHFYAVSEKMYHSLESAEREMFLKTHTAWKAYVVLQARFLAGDQGSAAPLYAREVMKTEIKRRTQLYKELLKGENLYTTGLSMYE